MKKNLIRTIFFIIGIIFISTSAYAEFELIVDGDIIDFGFMDINETKELHDEGFYHNQVACISDNNNTWYLKVHLAEPFSSGMYFIPYENFKWQVSSVINGDGIICNRDIFKGFLDVPALVYTSGPNDTNGGAVKIRFEYRISIPRGQAPGNYRAIVRYTMIELL